MLEIQNTVNHPFLIAFESAKVGDEAPRKLMKGVEDLDFFTGNETTGKPR